MLQLEEWGINLSFQKNSLTVKIWLYLALFSCIILIFLWFFQISFLDDYYEWSKKRDLNETANKIIETYDKNNIETMFNMIAYEKGVCIEVLQKGDAAFISSSFNRGCMMFDKKNRTSYQYHFIESGLKKQSYIITNSDFKNKILIYGVKLDNQTYAFISASLEPLDATTKILSTQLIYVTIIVLLLSFVIAYFISKKISAPIIELNDGARKMSKGDYNFEFNGKTDIAEIQVLSNTLNHAKNELSKTEELRRDLMANVSHDLKTPLTMIKAYAEMARDLNSNNKEKRNQNLNVIIEEADRLNILVNDILELSKVQASIEPLKKEKIDLTKLMEKILKRYDILRETENYTFIFEEYESIIICADIKKMEQVIYNLINNAINYTGENKTIWIKILKFENKIRVEITDSGKGISSKDLPHIWDKYYKNEKKHQRNVIGTGLGLSIVKKILEDHKFQYGVISKKGKGTTFYFEIPIER